MRLEDRWGERVDRDDEEKLFFSFIPSIRLNVYRNQGGARWISDSISRKVFSE